MKKQFFLALVSILLLVACGGDEGNNSTATENPNDNPLDQEEFLPSESGDEEENTNPPTLELDVPQQAEVQVFQVCQANLLNATWLCTKEDKTYKLFVNRQRSLLRVDEPGTEKARQRICELELSKSSSSDAEESSETTEIIKYAHYEWGHCVRYLNVIINDIQNKEGFKCEKVGEEFADKEDTKKHGYCTPPSN